MSEFLYEAWQNVADRCLAALSGEDGGIAMQPVLADQTCTNGVAMPKRKLEK